MATEFLLGLDALVRSVGINKATPHALFLGAGASITSGVPSAANCIWEWKRSIFLTNNPGLEAQFSELSLPSVRQKIQRWLDMHGKYPGNEAPDEYGFYIQECFPPSRIESCRPNNSETKIGKLTILDGLKPYR